MNWMDKLKAMRSLGGDVGPHLRDDGSWYCSVPGEIGGDGLLTSTFENAKSPQQCVEKAWKVIENLPPDKHLRIGGMDGKSVRWNGFMFVEVDPREYSERRSS